MNASLRWSLYAVAALGTVAAMVVVSRNGDAVDNANGVVVAAARPVPGGVASMRRPSVQAEPLPTLPERRYSAPTADPFGDTAPPPAPVAAPAPPPPTGPAAISLPTLPYTYIGRWIEDGHTIAFLSTPDGNNVSAQAGMVLGGGYQVESINDDAVVFKYLPLGARQTLAFAGAGTPGTPGTPDSNAPAPAPEDAN